MPPIPTITVEVLVIILEVLQDGLSILQPPTVLIAELPLRVLRYKAPEESSAPLMLKPFLMDAAAT